MTDAQPAPLQPPAATEAALTLTAPPPPQPVAATAAPRMAPAVEAAALPGLDAKVDTYLESLMAAAPRSPEFAAKATDVRTMGDGDIRGAAETSNRLLKSPVKALQEGGLVRGVQGRRDAARAAPDGRGPRPQGGHRRQEAPRHDPVRRQDRPTTSASTSRRRATSTASCTRCATARTSSARTTPRSTWRSSSSGTRWAGSTSTSTSPSGSTPGSPRGIAELRGDRPREGEGAARGRAVLRPAEAPGPAHPARGVDPELPGHRHRDQEQHRADQGRRPRVDDHGLGAAHRGDRRPGAGQPEARPRPDHRAQHDDQRHDRAHLRDAARQLGADPAAGGVGDDRAAAAAGGVREHLRDDGRDRHLQGAGPGHHGRHHRHPGDRGDQVPGVPRPGRAAGRAAWPRVPRPRRLPQVLGAEHPLRA